MNRLITTAGLAALGAASVAPTLGQDLQVSQKPWAIGGTIRGFYDDNYYSHPGSGVAAGLERQNSFGFEVSPLASYNLKRDQTEMGLSYQYTLRYYMDRRHPKDDQSHQVNGKVSHPFSDRYSVDLSDSFVVAQEPAIIEPAGGPAALPKRSEGDVVRNLARFQFNASIVEKLSAQAFYSNTYYDYEEDAATISPATGAPVGAGSHSAVLDRIEHLIGIDGLYQVVPKTTVSLGYQLGVNDYTSDDPLSAGIPGDIRDNISHFVTVGVKQNINQRLDVAAKVGVQFTDYYSTITQDETGPYAEGSARWGYAENSSLQVGVRHQRVATDVTGTLGQLVFDAEATAVYASVTHQISGKITLNGMAQYQHTDFRGSGGANASDEIFNLGATVAYQITTNVAAEAGYAYDRVDSDFAARRFYRNRVFVGARLTF